MSKFIRIFWGDVKKYEHQILKCDRVDETVFVYGKKNEEYLKQKGFDTYLMSEEPYDHSIASDHTMFDHRSLIHKLVAFDTAVKKYGEVVFIDWDCYKVKDIDEEFFSLLRKGNNLQVPLYIYPKEELNKLCDSDMNIKYKNFFGKLRDYLIDLSYDFEGNYVIPNTGFMYCNNSDISSKLVSIALDNNLETVPDELAVLLMYKDWPMEEYINKIEPNVVYGKHHADNSEWNDCQLNLNKFIADKVYKKIYFHHV